MEMTARRLVALTLGAVVLMALAKPPRPSGGGWDIDEELAPSDLTKRALTSASDSLMQVTSLVRLSATREEVRRRLAALPPTARNQVIADPRISASLRALWQRTYAATLAAAGPNAPALPVFVVFDTTREQAGSTQWIDTPGPASPGCATVVRMYVNPRLLNDTRSMTRLIHRRLGPAFPQLADLGMCAFKARYGAPSAPLYDWLRERGWRPVVTGLSPSTPAQPASSQLVDGYYYNLFWDRSDNGALGLQRRACAAGIAAPCLDAVAPLSQNRVVVSDGYIGFRWGWVGSPDLMNQLALSMGAEKFGELWRAADPLPVAYQRITGVPIDTLARRLLLTSRGGPLHAGATVTMPELLVVLMITLLLAGISTLAHPRRRKP